MRYRPSFLFNIVLYTLFVDILEGKNIWGKLRSKYDNIKIFDDIPLIENIKTYLIWSKLENSTSFSYYIAIRSIEGNSTSKIIILGAIFGVKMITFSNKLHKKYILIAQTFIILSKDTSDGHCFVTKSNWAILWSKLSPRGNFWSKSDNF